MEELNSPKQKKGLKKLWSKVRTHMRSGSTSSSTSKQLTDTSATQTNPTSDPIIASETAQPERLGIGEMERDIVTNMNSTPMQESPVTQEIQPLAPSQKDENTRRFERAQAIFQKYDLELDPETWNVPDRGHIERVQKPVRMRVKYTCHECKTTFGHDKICKECAHPRCKECIRYPPKKPKAKTGVKDKLEPTPQMPTKGPCHECRTEFDIGATECSNCHHKICNKCLTEVVIESPATAPPMTTSIPVSTV